MPAMKKTIIALFIALLVTGYAHAEQTERVIHLLAKEIRENKREGIFYAPNENIPFTGKAVIFHNGQKWLEEHYVNGKLNGLLTAWHDNGQKSSEHHYVDGELDGLSTNWSENGQKFSESHYVDGKQNGLSTSWFENGQKFFEGYYVNGKKMDYGQFGLRTYKSTLKSIM
jgi:antitoxin component YwqK of YwqJK toxin-antitoxin module